MRNGHHWPSRRQEGLGKRKGKKKRKRQRGIPYKIGSVVASRLWGIGQKHPIM